MVFYNKQSNVMTFVAVKIWPWPIFHNFCKICARMDCSSYRVAIALAMTKKSEMKKENITI